MKRSLTALLALAAFTGSAYAANVPVASNITTNTIWTSDNTYILDGFIFVKNNASLTIQPGTVIRAQPGSGADASALIVTRGSKIYAVGTASNPIIFTALNDPMDGTWGPEQGSAWGGLVVLGNAPINSNKSGQGTYPNITEVVEGVPANFAADATYGGTSADDNSGIIRYVSIRFGGSALESNAEINGLTLGGVGKSTVVEFVEVFASSDDGFEMFGGDVNLRYAIAAMGGDDGFDYDQGWSGKGQFWFFMQTSNANSALFAPDNGGEHDGEENSQGGPIGGPAGIFNATFVGGLTVGNNALRIRDNGFAKYYNSIFTEFKGAAVRIETSSESQITNGNMEFANNIWGDFGVGDTVAALSHGTVEDFIWTDAALGNTIASPKLRGISRTANGGLDPRPASDSPALNTAMKGLPANDTFFRQVSFKGAFAPGNNWAHGWTYLSEGGYLPQENNKSSSVTANLSMRTNVPAGGNAILGLTITGDLPKAVLLRAIGGATLSAAAPELAVLANPKMDIFDVQKGAVVKSVNNWTDGGMGNLNSALSAAFLGASAIPVASDTVSSIAYVILEPGNYGVIVSSETGAAGTVLIESYDADR